MGSIALVWAVLSLAVAGCNSGAVPRDFLYFNHNNNRALRAGNWKILSNGKDGPWELYDLAKDRCEQRDLAGADPERVRKMVAQWEQHDAEYVRVRESAPPTTKPRLTGG